MANACQAEKYGYCAGSVTEHEFIFHSSPLNQKPRSPDDEYFIKVDICDAHYKRVLEANKGIKPNNMYGWTADDALYNLFHYCCTFNDTFTFWYCTVHDDGVLVKDSNTDEVPEWCAPTMCKNEPDAVLCMQCDQMDWYKTGVINYDGKKVTELEYIEGSAYYTRMGGGFVISNYAYEYLVEDKENKKAKYIIFEEDSPIKNWFKQKEASGNNYR